MITHLFVFLSRLTDHIRILFNPIFPCYTPFEQQLFIELGRLLPPDQREALESQLKEINIVQRTPHHEMLHFYRLSWFRISQKRTHNFKHDKESWMLKKCRVFINDEPVMNVRIHIYKGHLYSVTFTNGPRKYKNERNIRLEERPLTKSA